VFRLKDEKLKRTLEGVSSVRRSAQISRALVAGGLVFSSLTIGSEVAKAQSTGTPASPGAGVTSGQTPGQAGLLPTSPSAVPQASSAAQTSGAAADPQQPARSAQEPTVPALSASLPQYAGQVVEEIRYEGVDFDKSDKLTQELTQKAGAPLDPLKVRETTRRLFATGRYRNIAVRVEKSGVGVTLIFAGIPRYYIGRVQIDGIKEDRLASLVEYGTQLNPGTGFTNAEVAAATELAKQVLAQNGYYEPTISVKTDRDPAGQQVNITFTVGIGPQARIGNVTLTGKDPGINEHDFRKKGKLKRHAKVYRETTSTALANLRNFYQKKDHLEATVSLQKSTYDSATKSLNYDFTVEQGPLVQVKVEGARFSKSRLHLLVPVYEEGTVDNDLLNEGTHNMKDYLQQQGYFDAKVAVKQIGQGAAPTVDATSPPAPVPTTATQTVLYTVDKGNKHKVISVSLQGNKYFSTDLLTEGLRVQKADAYLRSGRFSQALVTADQNKIQSIYRANGFNAAKVTSTVVDSEDSAPGKIVKVAQISVTFKIDEGPQQKFGLVDLKGVDPSREAALKALLQAQTGQPFSLVTLSGDRDTLLGYYLSNGFDQARVEVSQSPEGSDKTLTDVGFNITEGKQVFIGKMLESGVLHTKQKVVDKQLKVHAGDPLDQSALLETQRRLYDLALFNEVNAAVQNPTGDAELKNVLIQLTEAKRWDVTYGFGFEAQTGTPGCNTCTQQGTTKAQEGKAGVSPRVSVDVSRINVLGTQDSLSLHTTYGLLEKVATLTFQNPHLYGSDKFAFQVSGGYSNVQNITTFKSSTSQVDVRVTHKATRKDTFIYNFQYRRVAVDPNSLAISANLIPLLSQPVRVGGPGITWFHDTRSPSPLDAVKGSYTSVQNFFASSKFGSQTDFNRTDITNSTYYQFGKRKYVFARNTRLGFIESYGSNPNTTVSACAGILLTTNASCNSVPLPERLYAGGATSLRGFPINGAGPRDLQTGFPVGGSGALVNTFELRLPAPTLPYVGDSVSFVIFHDMGNVFQHVGDIFPSIGRFHQPNEATCEKVSGGISIGTCNFNYFSHTLGLGARYKTPVGPIRVDLGYNLNPPHYPVIPTQNANGTYVNNAVPSSQVGSHFNFFFSIGQSF
jgi:outer membrane protein insertion porin family